MTRASIALAVALVVFALPLGLDRCTAACEEQQVAAATPVPSCHHAGAATARIGEIPAPCGHQHGVAFTAVTAAADVNPRTHASPVASATRHVVIDAGVAVAETTAAAAGSPHGSQPRQLSIALRV